MGKGLDRILLIYPMDPSFSTQKPFAPFSLACLAAMVEDLVEIKILDATTWDLDTVMREVNAFGPQWVGITAPFTFLVPNVLKISRAIKAQYGNQVQVLVGGPGVTFIPDQVLSSDVVDAVVRGEGEATFREMVEQGSFVGVIGTSHWLEGKIHHNPARALISNLDTLPIPAYHLLDTSSVDIFFIETSRGCPYRCAFCSPSQFYNHVWRAKSPERVAQEFRTLTNDYGASLFLPTDENIDTRTERLERICQLLLEEHSKLGLWLQMRADAIARKPALIEHLAQVGTQIMLVGVESGNQETLDEVGKRIRLDQSIEAVKRLHQNGILALGELIIGFPHETAEMARQTVRFAMEQLNCDTIDINLCTPYPGTELYRRCESNGWLLTDDWWKYDQQHQVVKTAEWPAVNFNQLRGDLFHLFYNRADWIVSHFTSTPGQEAGAGYMRNFYLAGGDNYTLNSFADWAELIEGYRQIANPELGARLSDYSVRLRLIMNDLSIDLEIQNGQLQPLQKAEGVADVILDADITTWNRLLRLMKQDALSALIEGKLRLNGTWDNAAAFVRWCDTFQEIVDVQVVKRAPDAPTCLTALNQVLAEWPAPRPGWLTQGGRYLLKTGAGDLLLAIKSGQASEFRMSADRPRRIQQEVSLAPNVTGGLLAGDFRPLIAALCN